MSLVPIDDVCPDWLVARPTEDMCVTFIVVIDSAPRSKYGTIVMCSFWEDVNVQTAFRKIFPDHQCDSREDCWLVDCHSFEWQWHDHLDLPDGAVIRPYRIDRQTPNNRCGHVMDEDSQDEVNVMASGLRSRLDRQVEPDLESDSFSSMQQFVRWTIDDGRSSTSLRNLQYSASQKLSWVTPVRLQYGELYWAWTERHFDVVKAQLSAQGLAHDMQSMFGWFFRTSRQSKGDPFHWGLDQERPRALQVSSLMRGAGLADSLLYTVIPQVQSEASDGRTSYMFLVTPNAALHIAPLYLVVEHALQPPLLRQAIACEEPCQVKKVFELAGLGAWCTRRHICGIAFMHGVCRRDFKNDEIVEVPTASRVHLSVQLVRPTSCVAEGAATMPGVDSHSAPAPSSMMRARQVASLLFPEGTAAYDRTVRQAHEVLLHGDDQPAEGDQVFLMQNTNVKAHEEPARHQEAGDAGREDGVPSGPSTLDTRSFQVSTMSSGPPTFGVQPNTDFDWVLSMSEARRRVATYAEHADPRDTETLAHLLGLRDGRARVVWAMCPLPLLQVDVPVCAFADWRENSLFQLFPEYSRIFPVIGEVFQNVPSLVMVQYLPNGQVPLVVHITSTGSPVFRVYLAVAVERIVMIEDWIMTQVRLLAPTVLTFDGALVRGDQDVYVHAGAVFGVRMRAHVEMVDPGSSTAESGA